MKLTKNSAIKVLSATTALLLVPLVAMQFSDEVNWDAFDFILAGLILSGTGFSYVYLASKVKDSKNKLLIGAVLGFLLLLIWAELAVDVFGTPFAGD